VGHACGHNIIATAALGAGYALAGLADDLGIRVTVLGTPAEEKFGAKVDLIGAGAFDGASAAMMIHPTPNDVVDPNVIAIAELDIHFHGKTAHASAYPQVGINALDAFVQGYVNVSTLRQHLLPTDKIHGIVVDGGEAPNIIPDYTRSSWYVRAQTRDRLDELLHRVLACFEGAATATGCTLEVEPIGNVYDELISNPTLVDLFDVNARALGRKMARGSELPPSQAGSTDMGNVSRVVPAIHPMIGIDSHPAVNHQAEFAAHTITPSGELAIRDGALAMAWTVVDLAERDLWDSL
jgi:amidohydrolase